MCNFCIPKEKLNNFSFGKKLLFCFFGGALGALSLPPFSWPVFFFAGFILFAFYLREAKSFSTSFAFAFCYALGFHVAGLYWISASLFVDIARYIWVLPFSLVALPAWLALLFSLAAISVHPLRTRPMLHAFLLALTIFIAEVLRGVLFTGFPWNMFGLIWAGTPLEQSVSLFGLHGLTLLTLMTASFFSLLLQPKSYAWIPAAGFAALLSILALWGIDRLQTPASPVAQNITLRIVQPNISQAERTTFQQRMAALHRTVDLTSQPGAYTHILWPETMVPDFLTARTDLRQELAQIVPKGGALLTGTPALAIENGNMRYANALAILDEKGNINGLYEKHHLVPFGEFVPFRQILKTVPIATDVIGSRGDFSPGPGPRTLRAPNFPAFSPLICYEAIFSGEVTDNEDMPDLLIQITNDAWFGNTSGPYQHFEQARMRAIEEGLPLVRAANTGISAVVDPLGRITYSLALGKRGIIDAKIPLPLKSTLFRRLTEVLFSP